MIKDALGNRLEVGHLVLWNNIVCKIREVHDGKVLRVNAASRTAEPNHPHVVIELAVGISPNNPSPFIRIVDPASDAIVDSIAAGVS